MSDELYIKSIQSILNQKRLRNPRYSHRALARDLKIPASSLVEVLKGKKTVTPQMAYKIAIHLELNESQLLEYLLPTIRC